MGLAILQGRTGGVLWFCLWLEPVVISRYLNVCVRADFDRSGPTRSVFNVLAQLGLFHCLIVWFLDRRLLRQLSNSWSLQRPLEPLEPLRARGEFLKPYACQYFNHPFYIFSRQDKQNVAV